MKKLISVLGALCMLCASVPVLPASVQESAVILADAADSETGISYTKYSDHIEIEGVSGKKEELSGLLEIPSEIDGLPVTVIKKYAFSFCRGLTAVNIPDTVTSIEDSAFTDCKNLTSVTFPEHLPALGERVFTNTAWIHIPEGENSLLIKDNVLLKGAGSTGELVIPDGVTAIAGDAFCNCEALTSVIIPDSVTSIGERAFFGCTSLESVVIPDTVTNLGSYAFYDCYALHSVRLPANLQNMGIRVFEYSGLSEVIIPEGVTEIGNGAFSCCTALTSVMIPSSVTKIGEDAFGGTRLEQIILPDNEIIIGSGAFYLADADSVTIPDNAEFEKNPFPRCGNLKEIHVSETNPHYTVQDGVLYSKDMTTLIACPAGKNGEFVIPDSVTSIGDDAFFGCEKLTSVVIPDTVSTIGEMAFRDCYALTSVNLPSSVTAIADGTFLSCQSLESVEIPRTITKIGDSAFNFCTSLKKITVLNPDCDIFDSINTFRNYRADGMTVIDFDGTISGYTNSSAQNYAQKYGYQFNSLGARPERSVSPVQSAEQKAENILPGDADGSGKVDILDVITVNRVILGKETLSEAQLGAVDFNGNGKPDADEALMLMKYIVGLIADFS